MKILSRRIRALQNYLVGLNVGQPFYVALVDVTDTNLITRAGFTNPLMVGEQILPAAIGPVSRFNANGGNIIHRDRPMETAWRRMDIVDWHGNYHSVDIPYRRYPRTPIPPPSEELLIVSGQNHQKLVRSRELIKGVTPEKEILHIINLFLELFRECDTIQTNLVPVFNTPITRLNWRVLPEGNYPWNILRQNVQNVLAHIGNNKRRAIERRLQVISSHEPNFVAVGEGGFNGYIVFGFPNRNFFILESIYLGNATYVFGQNWAQLSQMTKERIMSQNLHQHRFVHLSGWENEIDSLFI